MKQEMSNLTVKSEKKRKTSENLVDSIIPAKKIKPAVNNKSQINKAKGKKQQGNVSVKKFKGTNQIVKAVALGTPKVANSGSPKIATSGTPKLANSNEQAKKSKQKGHFHELRNKLNANIKKEVILAEIDKKIDAIKNRNELTKTAKRKLKLLKKIRASAETGKKLSMNISPKKDPTVTMSKKRRERRKKIQENGNQVLKTEIKQENVQKINTQVKQEIKSPIKKEMENKKVVVKQDKKKIEVKQEKDSSESDFEMDDDENDSKESDVEEEENADSDGEENEEEEVVDNEESEEESEGSNEDDEGSDENNEVEVQVFKKPPQIKKENNSLQKNQSRYVLFVGNIPYDIEKQEIVQHFNKCGKIKDVRIQNDKNTNKPRGFGYIELENEESYQKALSLHHSTLKGRRINVLYSQGGKKKNEAKKGEIKAKNLKLQAMRQQGKLAGSVKENQKRSFRRNKKNIPIKTNAS